MPIDVGKKLQDEIHTLEYELNFELPKELQRARALGDLSENAEFHMAKQRQDYVRARLVQLKSGLAEPSLINSSHRPTDRTAFGPPVPLYDVRRDQPRATKLGT